MSMYMSDSMTVGYPDPWLQDAWAALSLLATQSAVEAARHASAEQIRSLRVLVGQLPTLAEAGPWESVTAATYFGISEASGNQIYETLFYDLWQALAQSGEHWDVAARLWPIRQWAEDSLEAVVTGIASAEPELAKSAMESHIRGAVAALDLSQPGC
jgi:DNA-binding FadR family transcriptional regulator